MTPPSTVAARMAARVVLVLLAVVALARCTNGTEPPIGTPGTVTYRLVSPNGAEGALLVRAPAAAITGVPAADGPTEVLSTTVGDERYVAVVHRFGAEGLTFELDVADVADPPELTIVQVAGPDDRLRDITGYALEIVP